MINLQAIDTSIKVSMNSLTGFATFIDEVGAVTTPPYFLIYSLTGTAFGGSMVSGNENFELMYQVNNVGQSRESSRRLQDICHAYFDRHYSNIVQCIGQPRIDVGPARKEAPDVWKAIDTVYVPVFSAEDTFTPQPPDVSGGFRFDQPTPSTLWIVNHNLGYEPAVGLFNLGGIAMWAQVDHTNVNQTIVSFPIAQSGYARLI